MTEDNQWFGDMMILQALADSDCVNEQEREVLARWIVASDRPSLVRPAAKPTQVRYWLCCGSQDPGHKDEAARSCIEAKTGHPEHCRFGTAAELAEWDRTSGAVGDSSESTMVCHEAYAALGTLLFDLAERGHPQAEKLMDNLSEARLIHKDVLPFADVDVGRL